MLPIVQLPFGESESVVFPLMRPDLGMALNLPAKVFGELLDAKIQKQLLEKGELLEAMRYNIFDAPLRSEIIELGISFQEAGRTATGLVKVRAKVFLLPLSGKGHIVLLPLLGLQTFLEKPDDLQAAVAELVQLDFSKRNLLESFPDLISLLWYGEPTVELVPTQSVPPTLAQRSRGNERGVNTHNFLKNMAEKVGAGPVQQLFFMDDAMQAAVSVFKGHYRRNLLLVGKSGVGKSALVAELARISLGKGLKLNIWSTTASAMIKELTDESGWKANMHLLCEELAKGGEILHLANLLELFEVGQYMGSDTSLADGLYDFLDRDRISVITEATEDELALIEVRNPRFTQVFHVVRLEEPK